MSIAASFGDQLEATLEVRNDGVVGTDPERISILEDEKWIDEKLGIIVEDHVEPVIVRRALYVEVIASLHMNYVVYARRSSDSDDKQVLSIDSQLDELRRFAAARGLRIDDEFTESASARSPGRPIFSEIMKRLRTGSVKGILVWSLDRLARNMVDGGALIYVLSEGRLAEIITPEATYTNTGDAKFMLAMQFGAAAKYTDDLSDAVKRGNRKVVEMGKVPGGVPIGYLKTHEHELTPGAGTVVPDPERFDLVKRLWKEVASSNCSISSLWQEARDEWGLTTRPTGNVLAKPVSIANVYHLLRNPFYTGKVIRGGVAHQGEHAPMISEEEFERVQARFRKGAPAHPSHAHYLYSGLLHCGHCGRLLVGERHDKHGHTYIYYRCGRRRAGTYQCHAPAPREEDITEAVVRTFGHVRIQPDFRDWALQALEWWTGDDLTSPEHLVRKAKRALAKAEREMTTLTDLVVDHEGVRAEDIANTTQPPARGRASPRSTDMV